MSRSSISSSSRLRRGALALVVCLLLLEMGVRLPPVKVALSAALDPYESLLWYNKNIQSYGKQLRDGSHYDLWLLGASYIMSGLDPTIMADTLAAANHPLTVQNYGYTFMQNLSDMAVVVGRWMLRYDQPRYALIGLQWRNMSSDGQRAARARSSPMERMVIYQDHLDDWFMALVYQNSQLFRDATLTRYALTVPLEDTDVPDLPTGGYAPRARIMPCEPSQWTDVDKPTQADFESHLARLDTLIEALRQNGVAVAVVNIPSPECAVRYNYSSLERYEQTYLDPLAAHLQAINVPFGELDRRFFAAYPDIDAQRVYYYDDSHPNTDGARLLSVWAGEFVAAWLNGLEQ